MARSIKIRITSKTKEIARSVSKKSDKALVIFGADVAKRSARMVPKKLGALKRSLEVTQPKDNAISIIYDANESLKYAVIQHYSKKLKHVKGDRLFLKTPLFKRAKRLQNAIASQLNSILN